MLIFINISGRLVLINASIIIKRRKNKQIKIESMTAFEFISGIHRTNGSDNEQLFGKSHSLFAAPGKAGMRYPPPAPVCCGLFDLYQVHDAPIIHWRIQRGGCGGCNPPLNFQKIVVIRVAVVIYLVVTSSNNPCVFVCVEWCCHWVLRYDRPQIGPALVIISGDVSNCSNRRSYPVTSSRLRSA